MKELRTITRCLLCGASVGRIDRPGRPPVHVEYVSHRPHVCEPVQVARRPHRPMPGTTAARLEQIANRNLEAK